MKKRILALLVVATLLIGIFAGCGKNDSNGNEPVDSSNKKNEVNSSDKENNKENNKENEKAEPEDENFNLTGLPIVNEPVSFRVMTIKTATSKKSIEEKEIYINLEKETNVNIEWEEIISSGWNEKINLAVNSNQLPDATYGAYPILSDVVSANQLVCVDDYIEYAPNLKKIFEKVPDCEAAARYVVDGKHYVYPGAEARDVGIVGMPLFINQTWLDNLGLETPTTTDELYDVLKAFKTEDPNGNGEKDEIPLGFATYWGGYDIQHMFGAWDMIAASGPDKYATFTIRDGKLDFNPTKPEFREVLEYFNKLYVEELTDPEMMTLALKDKRAKTKGDIAIYGVLSDWTKSVMLNPEIEGQYELLLPLKGPHGAQIYERGGSGVAVRNGLAIFNVCENPEILMRWMDYQNEGDNVYAFFAGPKGVAWDIDEETSEFYIKPDGISVPFEEYKSTEAMTNNTTCMDPRYTNITMRYPEGTNDYYKAQWTKAYMPYILDEFWIKWMPIDKASKESKEIGLLITDLSAHLQAFIASAVLEGITDVDWENHIKKCESLEYERIMEYWQSKYDNAVGK